MKEEEKIIILNGIVNVLNYLKKKPDAYCRIMKQKLNAVNGEALSEDDRVDLAIEVLEDIINERSSNEAGNPETELTTADRQLPSVASEQKDLQPAVSSVSEDAPAVPHVSSGTETRQPNTNHSDICSYLQQIVAGQKRLDNDLNRIHEYLKENVQKEAWTAIQQELQALGSSLASQAARTEPVAVKAGQEALVSEVQEPLDRTVRESAPQAELQEDTGIKPKLSHHMEEIVREYNQNDNMYRLEGSFKVGLLEEDEERYSQNSKKSEELEVAKALVLKEGRSGPFRAIPEEENAYLMVPLKKFLTDAASIMRRAISVFFVINSPDDLAGTYTQASLLKPAVIKQDDMRTYHLEERGIIELRH